jgi:glycosyltransferase involved in cell wall biosynthesis
MVKEIWTGVTLNFSGTMCIKQNNLLFIGPYSKNPKGGVAFVLWEYKKLFPDAYFVASTKAGNKFTKILGFIWGMTNFVYLLITRPKIKIVHIHGASYSSFKRKYILFKIAKFFNKKVIYHIHGAEYKLFYQKAGQRKKKKIKQFINNTDCIICLSKSWEYFFRKEFSPKRIEIIPNIISEPKIFEKEEKTSNLLLSFLFLGFVDKRKGIWLLLETLKDHKHDIENKAVFKIGGNGETQKLQKLIKEYGLTDIVEFVGWVSGDKKQYLLANADVYLLPSYNEGLPISILEAMSYSLPILSTNVGGIPEIVSDDNGIIIEPGNKKQLWESIQFFINADKKLLKQMGEASFRKVKPHLPEEVKNELMKIYEELL